MPLSKKEVERQNIQTLSCLQITNNKTNNTFFVGVGPGLAGEIPNTSISDGVESKDIYVDETIFLRGTEEK